MKEFKILSPTAILGYGYPITSFMKGIEANPDLIAVDAGSVDPGPYYLGAGVPFTDRIGVKRDLRYMIREGVKRGIPVMVGTAGGCGAAPHLDWCRDIVLELAKEEELTFKLGLIYSDIDKKTVIDSINAGKVTPLAGLPALTEKDVEDTTNLVAQMGIEPFMEAIESGCQVVLAGRAYDPSVFAALPIAKGYDPGLATHLGKILECAAIAATPGSGSDSVLGTLTEDSFILTPLCDERKFTKESTAAHTLYEKSDPYILPGPGGHLDLTHVSFTELDGGRVEVKGSRFVPEEKYTIKLEGTRCVGYRTISISGTHDPIMIEGIDSIIDLVKKRVDDILISESIEGQVFFHIYGKNGVMGEMEPVNKALGYEIGILIEVVCPTQEDANTICSITRSTLLHYGYEGRIATAGNLAFPFSPSDVKCGAVYEFSIYHIMEVEDQSLFKTKIIEAGCN